MSVNMPLVKGIFFEIHGSKFKPDSSEIASQAAKICKSHRAFFFSVCEHTLDRFLAQLIKFTQRRCVAAVLSKFEVVRPNVLFNGFHAVTAFGAFGF